MARLGEEQMIEYVEGNILLVEQFLGEYILQIVPIRPEASFLVWLDCRGLNMSHSEVVSLFTDGAKLALNEGAMFGAQGQCFMRLNVGTTRANLLAALESLKSAVQLSVEKK